MTGSTSRRALLQSIAVAGGPGLAGCGGRRQALLGVRNDDDRPHALDVTVARLRSTTASGGDPDAGGYGPPDGGVRPPGDPAWRRRRRFDLRPGETIEDAAVLDPGPYFLRAATAADRAAARRSVAPGEFVLVRVAGGGAVAYS